MSPLSFDLSAAPRDGTHVILALPNKQSLRSYWCKPKGEPEHWCMLSHKNEPVAWMLWPEHPFLAKANDEACETASDQRRAEAEANASDGVELVSRVAGGRTPAATTERMAVTAGETALQFIIDDVGSM
ncbi:hypothetical protein SAMN05892877_117123 [Rhizobium subbaraonis]|uniref:Uncharacterized protein n=1 Tax=Rhizobium subbaraonis TaxID=908946 RepID=A0A285UV20_9HYPH|nr:hypothetical protein [Rhizobium subbaraonis]SOC45734.1 hypothetical protein SAMN05892877_117123 [Rhizobium subbaraonis]